MIRRVFAGGLMVLVVFTAAAARPLFHLHLLKAEPAAGGTVTAPLKEVRLSFSQAPQLKGTSIRLLNASAKEIRTDAVKVDAKDKNVVYVTVQEPAAPGAYTVAWRAMSLDGHVLKDSLKFTLKAVK